MNMTQSQSASTIMWKYGSYLRREYQDKILDSLESVNVTSVLRYDPNNQFVCVPIDRKLAFDCQRIMWKERFTIQRNIYYNLQASK